MNDRDLETLNALGLDLFNSWSLMFDNEKNPDAKESMNEHLEALDLVLGFLEKSLDKKDEIKRSLR